MIISEENQSKICRKSRGNCSWNRINHVIASRRTWSKKYNARKRSVLISMRPKLRGRDDCLQWRFYPINKKMRSTVMLVRRNLETLKKWVSHFYFCLSYFCFRKVQQFSRGMVLMITCFNGSFYIHLTKIVWEWILGDTRDLTFY